MVGSRPDKELIMRSALAMAMCVALMGGCKDRSTDSPPPTSSSTAAVSSASSGADDQCAAKVKELGGWLETVSSEGLGPAEAFGATAIQLAEQPKGEKGARMNSVVFVKPDLLQVDGDKVGTDATAAAKVTEALKQRRATGLAAGFVPPGVDLYVDRSTPWSMVTATVDAIVKSGFRTVWFVFASPSKATPPAKSAAYTKLEAQQRERDNDESGAETNPMEGVPADVLKQCPAALNVVREILKKKPTADERSSQLAKQLPLSLAACQCRADFDGIKAVQWVWLGRNNGPATVAVKVKIAAPAEADARKVESPKTATWSDALKGIVEGGDKAVSLVAK